MSLPPEVARVFEGLVISGFLGKDVEKHQLSDLRNQLASAVAPMWQHGGDPVALKAANSSKVAGFTTLSNRGYIRKLVREYWLTMPDPAEPGITPEEAARRRQDREKLFPSWDGVIYDTTGNQIDTEDKFNTSDLRAIREFGKRLIDRDERTWWVRLFQADNWAVGDIEVLLDFKKVNDAQSAHRNSLRLGTEFKDDKSRDLGLYGGWKNEWGLTHQTPTALVKTHEKVSDLRRLQLAHDPKFNDEADKAQGSVSNFSVEDSVLDNPAFLFALQHGDIREFARLSPLWDNSVNWVRAPEENELPDESDGITRRNLRQYFPNAVIERARGNRSKVLRALGLSERDVPHFEATFMVTIEQLGLLSEVMYRHPDRVTRLSRNWEIGWSAVWDHFGDGGRLIDFIRAPKGHGQMGIMSLDSGYNFLRGVWNFTIDLPGKVADAKLVTTLVTFLVSATFFGWLQIALTGGFDVVATLLLAVLTTYTYRNLVIRSQGMRTRRLFLALVALMLIAVCTVPGAARNQRLEIQQNETQQMVDRTKHLFR